MIKWEVISLLYSKDLDFFDGIGLLADFLVYLGLLMFEFQKKVTETEPFDSESGTIT